MKAFTDILADARRAATAMADADSERKNTGLRAIARALRTNTARILDANAKDVIEAKDAGRPAAMVDRLTLNAGRIEDMAGAVEEVANLNDPVGEIFDMAVRPNGLRVGRMRLPLGVIGIVFEARPNVIVDAGVLCLKAGNAAILRGGTEARHSNAVLGDILAEALNTVGLDPDAIQVVRDPDRELVLKLIQASGQVDLMIPRGGEGLIRFVADNARVPVLMHYKGVCHVYVDADAKLDKAREIIVNAKVQRPGVCNAAETLLVHRDVADEFLPDAAKALIAAGVELRGCEKARTLVPEMTAATDADWPAEFLDLVLAVKVVDDLDAALDHIRAFGSNHTEAIVTENLSTADAFLRRVDASCVVVNASTRFNDGGQLGLGAEIGISTSKMHAYGPMGLNELTAAKFIVIGSGQVRQ